MSFATCSQCQITFCYTGGLLCAGRGMTVPRNSLTRYTARHMRIRRLVQFIFVGAVYNNALTNCAARLCRALCRVAHMCSRTVSDTANMSRHGSTLCSPTVEKILCRSPFRSGLVSPIFAVPSKGKRKIHKKEETVGCFLLVPRRVGEFPRGVSAHSAAW